MTEKLTRNFPLSDFLKSQIAARQGIILEPPPEVIANLKRLCVLVLQPTRDALNRPIIPSSGWRPIWLNKAVKGAPNSAHLTGRAADVNAVGCTAYGLAQFIQSLRLPVDKCILEFGQWVHVQVAKDGEEPRRQYLTARKVGKQTIYEEGINL